MADELRTCSRTGCRWPAAASLSYRYASAQVWLLDLAAQPDPSLYDLCPHHADALVVPRGWERVDQRRVRPARVEPSADEIVAARQAADARAQARSTARPAPRAAPATPAGAGGYASGGDRSAGAGRYDVLARALPRLAAEVAAQAVRRPDARVAVQPSRELSPLVPEGLPSLAASAPTPAAGAAVPEVPGQLGLDLAPEPTGVVVPLSLAGARRRREGAAAGHSTVAGNSTVE